MKNLSGQQSGRVTRLSVFSLLMSCLSPVFGQTTYYVAATGNDANSGRSADSPFQSLTKMNTVSLQPGDAVLLRRGDTFRGTLYVRQSGSAAAPIVVDAYGSGAKPIVAGSVPVSNWTSVGNNTWQANCPACGSQVTGLYRDAVALPLGRYPNLSEPNKGYLTVQSHSGKTQFTSQQGLSTNWTGGEAVVRSTRWVTDRGQITQQNGNTLSITASSNYDLADGWGFFIQNHPATLDQSGEWYYNPGNKTILLYDAQNNPNNQFITATAYNEGVNTTNVSFVTVRNLQITQTLATGLLASNGSNLTFSGNDITNSGVNGMYVAGSGSNVLVENNLIEDANNNGFHIDAYQNFTCRGNTLRRIGMIPGRGNSGDGSYFGLQSYCSANTVIENNALDQIGYIGISFVSNAVIRYNQVSNFCATKSDGGGIYTWNGNRNNVSGIYIQSNIISGGVGGLEGTPGGSHAGANGIFLDDCSQNAEVTNNTTFGSQGIGIFLRGALNITLKNNTSFNNSEEQLLLAYNNSCTLRNNVIQNNILFARTPQQVVADYETNANDLNEYGQFDYNYYVRPFEDQFKIRAIYNPGTGLTGGDLTLAEWQAKWGQDRNSYNSPITYKTQMVSQMGASLLNQSFSDNVNGWSGYSPYGNGRLDWDNTNRLDGGSMRLAFASPSGRGDSYLLTFINIGAVTKGKTYQLLFDGVASGAGKRVQIYPRQLSGGYQDLASDRASYVLGTGRQAFEGTFTATADESNAILIVQVQEDGQTAWFDNIRLQEATLTNVNPDDYIKFLYNPTGQARTESLNGVYRDVKNTVYTNQVTVPAYSSVVLLKDPNPTAPPATTLRDPENPANTVAGLDYQYYEGYWETLPNFNALTPAKTGTAPTIDLSVRNRDEQFGLQYKGYINIPADGTYTFYTATDDGSKFYIGTTEVVSNDGQHGTVEKSGSIGLKAGKHAITLTYFQGGGGKDLSVSYSGPGVAKQVLPSSALYRVGTTPPTTPPATAGTGTGLRAEYFNNMNLTAPAALVRTDATVDFNYGNNSPVPGTLNADNVSVRWSGQVEAPVSGNYTFSTISDDGVRLWVNGVQVINNWTDHAPTTDSSPAIALTAGQKYDIRMEYYENAYGAESHLLWAYPGQGQQVIPQTRLYPAATTTPPTTPPATAGTGTGLRAEYFNNMNLTAPAALVRTDATVDFNYGNNSPVPGTLNADNVSVRWSGQVEAPVSGNYTFSTISDDGVRLWVNGVQVINNWTDHAPTTNSSPAIALTAGQKYDIRMEYYENAYGAESHLLWAYPGQGQQVIPQTRLYPAAATTPPTTPTATAVYLSDLTWVSATNGYGPVERDRSNGDQGANDGRTLTLNGVTYAKGLGAHAASEIVYNLNGQYTTFLTDIGIDDEMNGLCGSLEFAVYVDNILVYSSGVMDNNTPTKSISLPVTGKQTLKLVLIPGSDYCGDHGDWAGARLIPAGSARIAAQEIDPALQVQVYPVPARESVWVRYYAVTAGELTLQLVNNAALPVMQVVHPVVAGENVIRVPVRGLTPGLYIMTLIQNQQRITRKVLVTD